MTTPERLRRRQRIEGIFLIILGLLMVASTLWFRHQDTEQKACLTRVIAKQNEVLTLRGDLARQDSQINVEESSATRGLIVDVFAATTGDEARAAFEKAQKQWAAVDERRAEVKQARSENPIPDLPEGTCD